jgi:ATP-dependent Clp protease protease subunit
MRKENTLVSKGNILDLLKSEGIYTNKPLVQLHTFYINGEIESPDNYTDVFEIIRNATQNDVVKIHINSPGGDLFTAIQFMRVLGETEAKVITSVEGACMSAATLIFLCGEQFEVSEHSVFMFHNYSTIMMGKGGELYDNIVHDRKWSENLLKTAYEGFLEEDEITSILNNKDIWISGDEIQNRLENYAEVKRSQMEEVEETSEESEENP